MGFLILDFFSKYQISFDPVFLNWFWVISQSHFIISVYLSYFKQNNLQLERKLTVYCWGVACSWNQTKLKTYRGTVHGGSQTLARVMVLVQLVISICSNYCLFCHFPDYIHFKTNKEVCFKLNIFPACVMKILYLVYVQISSNSLNYIAQTIW